MGKRPGDTHFTGSVVYVQDGTFSASGIAPFLLIDGQQRVTTLTLLLAALADFARSHPERQLRFSHSEIMGAGYLVNAYKQGEDHYKLTLSQGDKPALFALIGYLEDADSELPEDDSSRVFENYRLFRSRIEALEDPNLVWDGIQRLMVVAISLDAGKDNPQLIFESMNSTGKDLSSADLIRNFVLMGLPREEQDKLYRNHWRKIEETLGADGYDEVFDDFVRNYLTVLYAPEPLAVRDVYPLFKRHVVENGYDKDGRIIELLRELETFARYFANISFGAEKNSALKLRFNRIARLQVTVVNPLLMSFYEDFDAGAFTEEDFARLLDIIESYLLRRAVCDAASNSLQKFFSSVIAKMNRVQDEGKNYVEAFTAYLLLEAGTARRFPSDAEFIQRLQSRDMYHFRRSFYVLEGLENAYHPKDPVRIDGGTYTIEHVMPQNALAHEEWIEALGDRVDEFEALVNNLGNLTLTAYNSELSDGTFAEKRERVVGGYDKERFVISRAIQDADVWTPEAIEERAKQLVTVAIQRWGIPELSQEILETYDPKPEKTPQQRVKTPFKTLFDAGLIKAGTTLVSTSPTFSGQCMVTDEGKLMLPNGELFASPSLAAVRSVELQGGSGSRNGWTWWKIAPDGSVIDEIRKNYISLVQKENNLEITRIRELFWSGFYEYCSDEPNFVDAFGDLSLRSPSGCGWVSFGLGLKGCHAESLFYIRDNFLAAQLCFDNVEYYKNLIMYREDIDRELSNIENANVMWNDIDLDKKTRAMYIMRRADAYNDDWQEMYESLSLWLLRLRSIAHRYLKE